MQAESFTFDQMITNLNISFAIMNTNNIKMKYKNETNWMWLNSKSLFSK